MALIKPSEQRENPVERILGIGVTAFGTADVYYRTVFEEQLAEEVALNKPFLGGATTNQSEVVVLRYAKADFEESKQSLADVEGVRVDCPDYQWIIAHSDGTYEVNKAKERCW